MIDDQFWLYPAVIAYLLAGGFAFWPQAERRLEYGSWAVSALLFGALCVALAITERWMLFGQGPFLTLYEVLISSLFSLSLVYGLAALRFPVVRAGAPFAIGVLLMLLLWAVYADPGFKPLPTTYQTPWLWAHVLTGKLFLGCCLVATSLGLWLMFKRGRQVSDSDQHADGLGVERQVWHWLGIAFLFHNGMLIAGAVWAQDAWGRYWDWDPLETWAFVTWLCMAVALHGRRAYRIGPRGVALFPLGTFVLAFLPFFGVPFISVNPHQGAV